MRALPVVNTEGSHPRAPPGRKRANEALGETIASRRLHAARLGLAIFFWLGRKTTTRDVLTPL
jgi:hypothetical protein